MSTPSQCRYPPDQDGNRDDKNPVVRTFQVEVVSGQSLAKFDLYQNTQDANGNDTPGNE